MNEPADPNRSELAALERELQALRDRVSRLEAFAPPDDTAKAEARAARVTRVETWESQLGGYWLSRLGIVSLITGAALLIITYFGQLGPFVRVALGYAIAAAIAWAGHRLSRSHRVFGEVLFGGGLSVAYFVTYALHFVEAVRLIQSEVLGVALVAAAILAIVAVAHRLQSETVAGIALFLALHTGMLSDVTALTLICTTLLAVGAVFFVAKNRWVIVPLSSVVAVYSTHATWAWTAEGEVGLSLSFLAVDFVLFASAALIRPEGLRGRSVAALALLNWIGIALLGGFELDARAPQWLFEFLLVLAGAHAALAAVAALRRAPRILLGVYLALSILTFAAALPARWQGIALILGWLALAIACLVIARQGRAAQFGWIALPLLLAAMVETQRSEAGALVVAATALAALIAERLHPDRAAYAPQRALFVVLLGAGLLLLSVEVVPQTLQTLGWACAAFAVFIGGFVLKEALFRWAGFALLALAGLRLLFVELRSLSADQRILTFLAVGALLLLVSFIYTRRRARQP